MLYQTATFPLFLPPHCLNCKYFFLKVHDWLIKVPKGWLLPFMPNYSHTKEQRIEWICVYTHVCMCVHTCVYVCWYMHRIVCVSLWICVHECMYAYRCVCTGVWCVPVYVYVHQSMCVSQDLNCPYTDDLYLACLFNLNLLLFLLIKAFPPHIIYTGYDFPSLFTSHFLSTSIWIRSLYVSHWKSSRLLRKYNIII